MFSWYWRVLAEPGRCTESAPRPALKVSDLFIGFLTLNPRFWRGSLSFFVRHLFTMKIMRTSFYTYFSSAYGTLWLAMFVFSFVTQSRVRTGEFGYYGFPIIALIYALYRRSSDTTKFREDKDGGIQHDAADA
jgi:hypothetical protein